MNRSIVSLRDLLLVLLGVLLGVILRSQPQTARAADLQDAGLSCGNFVLQTDQTGKQDFDAFVLNVKTGELYRTRGGGSSIAPVAAKK